MRIRTGDAPRREHNEKFDRDEDDGDDGNARREDPGRGRTGLMGDGAGTDGLDAGRTRPDKMPVKVPGRAGRGKQRHRACGEARRACVGGARGLRARRTRRNARVVVLIGADRYCRDSKNDTLPGGVLCEGDRETKQETKSETKQIGSGVRSAGNDAYGGNIGKLSMDKSQ